MKITILFTILILLSTQLLGASSHSYEDISLSLKSARVQVAGNLLRLSLQQALKMALENNLDIQIKGYDTKISQQRIKEEEGQFDLIAYFSTSYQKDITESFNYISAKDLRINDFTSVLGSISQKLVTGGDYNITYNHWRYQDNNPFNYYNPYYIPALSFQITQPLLKNRGSEINKKHIYVAKNNHRISNYEFKQQVMEILNNVCRLYYDLLFQMENLKIKQDSLKLAQDHLEITRLQIKIGTQSPLELAQVEAEVASREADIIFAERLVKDAQDELLKSLSSKIDIASLDVIVEPTDEFSFEEKTFSLEECVKLAKDNRPELVQNELEINNKNLDVNYYKNQKLPQIDIIATLSFDGLDGNKPIIEGNPFIGEQEVVGLIPGGLGGALKDLLSFDYRDWKIGVNVTIPIQNRLYKAAYARSKIELEQAKKRYQNTTQHIILDVVKAVRAVENNKGMLDATKKARELSEEQLEAEKKKFTVGTSSNYMVLQMQQNLAIRQFREKEAIKTYKISSFDLKRVLGTLLDDMNIEIEK